MPRTKESTLNCSGLPLSYFFSRALPTPPAELISSLSKCASAALNHHHSSPCFWLSWDSTQILALCCIQRACAPFLGCSRTRVKGLSASVMKRRELISAPQKLHLRVCYLRYSSNSGNSRTSSNVRSSKSALILPLVCHVTFFLRLLLIAEESSLDRNFRGK